MALPFIEAPKYRFGVKTSILWDFTTFFRYPRRTKLVSKATKVVVFTKYKVKSISSHFRNLKIIEHLRKAFSYYSISIKIYEELQIRSMVLSYQQAYVVLEF